MDFSELIKCAGSFRFYIMGNHGVGKSCLLEGFLEGRISYFEGSQIFVDSELKMVPRHSSKLNVQIWDSPDIKKIGVWVLQSWSKRDIDAVILVYDCTDRKSFNDVKNLLDQLNQNLPDTVFKLLVGNKSDLHNKKAVDYSTAKKYADELQIPFIETSAVTGPNLKQALKFLISNICEKRHAALKRKREEESREEEEIQRQERMQQKKEQESRKQEAMETQKRMQQKKEQLEREQQAKIQETMELQQRQQQEEKRQREKERREKERVEKNKEYVEQLLSPFLEKLATNATSSQQPSATVPSDTKPQGCPPVEQRENEMMREIEKFDCEGTMADISRRWKIWRKTFELYITVKDITDDAKKKETLLYCAGTDVQDIYEALVNGKENMEPGPSKSATTTADEKLLEYERAMSLLDDHFTSVKNVVRERFNFRNMRHENNETIGQYAARLKRQARTCNFGKMLEEQIRDQIIEKCRSENIRAEFLKSEDKLIKLERFLKMSRTNKDVYRKPSTQEMNGAVQDANQNHLQEDESSASCNRNREPLHAAEDKVLKIEKRDAEKDINKD